MEERPDPEVLLKRVQEEEYQQRGGKLKIYLGAAPGVGKTYTMLQDAIIQRARGIDVVVGIAESHGRQEIESLLKELEMLPRQEIDYRGQKLSEFDLDGALKRNPQLILVDEMAHTNAPGSRHKKRWQDIKELMNRGIDVYTTLNVQHIESLNDDVSKIILAPVKETVPDSMLEKADIIEMVDLPPEDLLKRLQEGKVYYPERAELAQKHFFRKGNLTALRELALRTTAQRVGTQVLLYRKDEGIKRIWSTKEKILVCVGSGPESVRLIRAACRDAATQKAEWLAAFVDTARTNMNEEKYNQAIQHLRMAEQLGAETRILTGFDVVTEILSYAREQNVTQIMICKHIRPHWKNIFRKDLTDELVRQAGDINVLIMTGEDIKPAQQKPVVPRAIPWVSYIVSIGIVALATLFDSAVSPYLRSPNLLMVYLLAVIAVSLLGEIGPAILACLLSVITYGFFFVPPSFTFGINDFEYILSLIVMLFVTLTITHLTILTRRQAESARHIEHQTSALYKLSRRLANTRGIDKLLETGTQYLSEIFNSDVIALWPQNSHLVVRSPSRENQVLDAKELGVAQWVYELGQIAGLGTDTLPFSNALYIPLSASKSTVGVLRVQPKMKSLFRPEQMRLLEACANQIALALEVDNLEEKTHKSEIQTEINRVRNALLQAVSQDLHAPLRSIMGSASTQIEMGNKLNADKNLKLARNIFSESEQLSRLINNLLQISYMESDQIHLQMQTSSLINTIDTVIRASTKKLGKRAVNVSIPAQPINIAFDNTLLQEVFNNLIDNIVKFTPHDSPIDISVTLNNDHVLVCVDDRGPGIVPDEIDKLFEKFYRGRMIQSERGLGLGLAICKYIVEAHGGKMWAENRSDGGASFRFTLPL